MIHWTTLRLNEGNPDDSWGYKPGDTEFARFIAEYRDTEAIHGFFLNPMEGQDPERAWDWGPLYTEVDFSGLDEALTPA